LYEEEPLTPTSSLRISHQWVSGDIDKAERVGLLHVDERAEAGFEGIPELKRHSTPPKSSFSYFARMLWLELDPLADELPAEEGAVTFEDMLPLDAVRPEPRRRSMVGMVGIDFRCFRYISSMSLITAVLVHGSYLIADTRWLHIEVSKLLLWMALQFIGFGYVSGVTERRCPLLSRYGNFSEVVKLMCLAPVLFLVGPAHTLAGHNYLPSEAFIYNYCYYTCPFMLGLNWTHFQRLRFLRGVSLSPAGFSQMAQDGKAIMTAGAVTILVIGALCYHIFLIVHSPIWELHLSYSIVLVLGIVGITRWLHATHELHLHHFFTCCVLIPFTSFHTPASAVCQGLLAGIYVEGVARFGMGYFIDQWNLREVGYRSEWSCCCIPLH